MFHENVSTLLNEYIATLSDRTLPVVDLASPNDLKLAFANVGVATSLLDVLPTPVEKKENKTTPTNSGPHTNAALLRAVQLILQKSVRTGHPQFYNQLYGRVNLISMAGDWISTTTNTNGHTFECAPVATLLESEILTKVAHVIGGKYVHLQGSGGHDGLLVPGGSIANLYAMHVARYQKDPHIQTRGMNGGPQLVAYCSASAHYSYLKTARLLGIGSDNLRRVPVSSITGAMAIDVLAEMIAEDVNSGKVPFFIGSTAGTTVVGGYDDFKAIQKLANKYDIWHHVDACWGGAALLSPTLRYPCCDGIEDTDSISWNPHKMLGCALQTSILLISDCGNSDGNQHPSTLTSASASASASASESTLLSATGSGEGRHANLLSKANGTHASYLFQPDKLFGNYDVGDKTIQCGRKTDSIKLWLMWKSLGDQGIAQSIEKCYSLAHYMVEKMMELNKQTEDEKKWLFVVPPSCTNICFWYVPKQLRPFVPSSFSEEEQDNKKGEGKDVKMHSVAPRIKASMQREGKAMIGFQTDVTVRDGHVNFFRMVFSSCETVEVMDVDKTLKDIAIAGEGLEF